MTGIVVDNEKQETLLVKVVPTGKAVGADIVGVDLSGAISPDVFSRILSAWHEHLVLRFHDQTLSKEQLLAFSQMFGELDKAPINISGKDWVEGHPSIAVMSNIKVDGKPVGSLGNYEAVWHTDMSYQEITPSAALLYAIEIPEVGGNTGFANMYLAYETLPADLKALVADKHIKHDASRNSAGELRKGLQEVTDPRDAPGAVHPIVVRHPDTNRKALFLGRRHNAYVVGMELQESEDLLDKLFGHATQPRFTWFQEWKVGDLLMWDNRCTMHMRQSFDANARRFLFRAQVKGGRPVAA